MNFNRMTIRPNGASFDVFKLKREQVGGYSTDMAAKCFSWIVPAAAAPRFSGSYEECRQFIEAQGAQFQEEV